MKNFILGSLVAALGFACGTTPVTPDAGHADAGADAGSCTCFTHGKWTVDNLSPCFASDSSGQLAGVLSTEVSGGVAMCPADLTTQPTSPWSTDSLTTNCVGHFRLCL